MSNHAFVHSTGIQEEKLPLLATLEKGEWAFDLILPSFRSTLLEQVSSLAPETSTTFLTANFYRKANLPVVLPGPLKLVGSNTTELAAFLQESLAALDRRVELAEVDADWEACFEMALELIGAHDPGALHALREHMTYVCTLQTEDFRSASHPHYFGTLYLKRVNDPRALAVSLVHELAHQELFLINLVDRLILSESDYKLAHAPYQGKSRPPIGRLHSAHALYRMISLERRILPDSAGKHEAVLKDTVATFGRDELTNFGWRMVHEVY